jgi:hypothetical protein
MGNGIYFKIAGWVNLDMPQIFAIKVNLYLLQILKYKTKRTNMATVTQNRIYGKIAGFG